MYFIRTSNASVPPGAPYIRLSIGDMSDWRMDCRISMTTERWTSCGGGLVSLVLGGAMSPTWSSVAQVQRRGGDVTRCLYLERHPNRWTGSVVSLRCLWSFQSCLSYAEAQRTFPLSSAPYGGFSKALWRAPSLSPPRSSCRIDWALVWTSAVETGATAGARELRSKLAGLSGSKASMLMVRQLMLAMVGGEACVRKSI